MYLLNWKIWAKWATKTSPYNWLIPQNDNNNNNNNNNSSSSSNSTQEI